MGMAPNLQLLAPKPGSAAAPGARRGTQCAPKGWSPLGVAEGGEGARFVELGVWDALSLLPLALQYRQKLKIQ